LFWWPGASGIVDRWQSQSAAIYARDLARYRAEAVAADQSLHAALGAEPWAQRKARLDALSIATKPDEFAFVRRSHPELHLAAVRLSGRILLAGAVMGVVLYPLSRFSIAISLPAGGLAYVIAIYLIRAIEPEEWRLARDGLLARLRPSPRTA